MDDPPVLVDIREPHEMATGVLPGAHLIPRGSLEKGVPAVARKRTVTVEPTDAGSTAKFWPVIVLNPQTMPRRFR